MNNRFSGALVRSILFVDRLVKSFVPGPARRSLAKMLYTMGLPRANNLNLDIVGGCNLRCPSCPVGNMSEPTPKGLMDKGLFEAIVRKARREHGIRGIGLFNWAEPFLHPELPEFVRIVKRQGLYCSVSSNFNLVRNLDELVQAGLDALRISVSGFTQESYKNTHVRGNIERVKQNMRLMSETLKRHKKARTAVSVFYHKYVHNLAEMEQMRSYVRELGFAWEEKWAHYMPLEKMFQLLEGKLSSEENDFVTNRLALPLREAVAAAERLEGHQRCTLLEDQIVLDHLGNVNLCCVTYSEKNQLGAFLDLSREALEQAKSNHPTCTRCLKNNLHLYFTYHPDLMATYDELAQAKIRDRSNGTNIIHKPAA